MEADKSEIHHNGDVGGKNADEEVQEVAVVKNGTPSKKKNEKAKIAAENEASVLERRKSLRTRATPKKYNEEDNSDFEIEETFNYVKERDPLAVEITRVQKNVQKSIPKISRKSNDSSKTQVGLKSQVTISPAVPVSLVPRVKQQAGFVLVDTQSILTGKGPVALSSVPASITVSSVPAKKSSNAKNSSKNSRSNSATSATVVDPFEQLGLDEKSFIVEAPSFVIPYLIEKPAENSLKNELAKSAVELDSEGSSSKKPKNEDKSSMKSEMQQFANEDYFSSPIGKFFLDIGLSLVQGFVQEDVLRVQKRKTQKGGQAADPSLQVEALEKGLEVTRAKNSDLMLKTRQCDRCNFQTESALVMAYHWTSPLTKGHGAIPTYLCHYCDFQIAPGDHPSPAHAIAFHLEQDHGIRARIEPEGSSLHQCPLCPFEDSMKGKVTRHIVSCQKRFLPGKNLEPPRDWEPPAKVAKINPRVANSSSLYPLLNSMAGGGVSQNSVLSSYHPLLPKSVLNASAATLAGLSMLTNEQLAFALRATQGSSTSLQLPPELQVLSSSKVYRNQTLGGQSLYSLALGGNQILQQLTKKQNVAMSVLPGSSSTGSSSSRTGLAAGKGGGSSSVSVIGGRGATMSFSTNQQPSISITALPRLANNNPLPVGLVSGATASKDEITCEICDSNIKDLEQLRHHMQWIHKVKIHPKMIHNRPPLNCQKCQCRFFTDQGLERHLLGSHGLVTSSMQEAANKGQDGGRCPICGRVHQWKLLSHVVKDHGLTLKPAHLSYKCTVCTATFGMYKLFESHVYTAHSVVAKKVLDKNTTGSEGSASSSQLNSDEITVIPTCQNCQSAGEKCDNCRSSGSKRTVDVIDLSDDDDDDADKQKAVNSKSQVTITKVPSPAKRVRKDEETN